ncbi:hypothetical protein GWK47_015870 [Chionoecetes opilio]|uniref:Uncharacterized protein n=1 Tax=Chionoecetes opilio TaxID=41210 RepID=A0A8J4XUU8_CHIOP|nr:hypothetical protein GWK47_015870 [Chionoecetes opilio]
MGNPFKDDTPELLALDTRNVIDHPVVNTVRTVEPVGKKQYETYKNTVMGTWKTFFKHENPPYPPSLAERGKLRKGKKSDLTNILAQKSKKNPLAHLMLECSMNDGEHSPNSTALLQHTKRFSVPGWHLDNLFTRPNNRHQLLKAAVGHWMQKQSPGFLSGARSLRQQSLIFAESLEVLVMALEALHEEAKPLGLEVSWLKTKVQMAPTAQSLVYMWPGKAGTDWKRLTTLGEILVKSA